MVPRVRSLTERDRRMAKNGQFSKTRCSVGFTSQETEAHRIGETEAGGMKQTDIISLAFVAVLIAAAVSTFVVPRLETEPITSPEVSSPAPSIASATIRSTEPDKVKPLPNKSAVLRQKDDGHYWGLADVDGFPVDFMVDTGASVVALTFEDAKRLRLNPEDLDYKWKISTAGGQTLGASVLLESIRIGGVEIENVEAMILREGLEQNLLGMSFLGQLYSYEFRGKQLIIRQ